MDFNKVMGGLSMIQMKDVVMESLQAGKKYNSLIFDFGSVLIKNTSGVDAYKIYNDKWRTDGLSEADLKLLFTTYYDGVHNNVESEAMPLNDSIKAYKMRLPKHLEKYAEHAYETAARSKEIFDYTEPLLKYLKSCGYRLYYLSNWSKASFQLCKEKGVFDILKYFNGGIFSYQVGLMKPDVAIYKMLLQKYRINPAKAVFFDDKQENIDAARKAGIDGCLFTKDTVTEIMKLKPVMESDEDVFSKLTKKVDKRPDRTTYRFYNSDKELVGTFGTSTSDWNDGLWIVDLSVTKPHRRHGYGTELVKYAIHDLGCDYLKVLKGNDIAKHLYDELGFELDQEDDKYYFMRLNKDRFQEVTEEGKESIIEKVWYVKGKDSDEVNACVKVKGFDKPLRGRSEILIVKGDNVFLSFKSKSPTCKYRVPGGGWNEDEDHKAAAVREAREEVLINSEDVKYIGNYIHTEDTVKDWIKDKVDRENWWYGTYTELYVGKYKSKYTGDIAEEDKDTMAKDGKWYKIEDVYTQLLPEHQAALSNYVKTLTESAIVEEFPIMESWALNKDDIYINVDKFINGDSNVLLITGLSGSGKSTLGTKMAIAHKAEFIELDLFEKCKMFTTDSQLKEAGDVFYDYFKSHPKVYEGIRTSELKGKEFQEELKKFVAYTLHSCRSDKKRKYVIEGVQIYSCYHDNTSAIKSYPLIIKGTSAVTSLVRRLKRSLETDDRDGAFRNTMSELPQCIAWYIEDEKVLQKFVNSVEDGVLVKESYSDEKAKILQDIFNAFEPLDIKPNISKKDMDEFINGENPNKALGNCNLIDLRPGSENYKQASLTVSKLLKNNPDFKVSEDNYGSLWLSVKEDSPLYIKEEVDTMEINYEEYFTEANDNTYYIRDEIYPIVEKVLSTPQGDRKFRQLVETFIDKNGDKLMTSGPVYMVPFTDRNKAEFYALFHTNEKELSSAITKMTKHVNEKASWRLIKQNPIFCLFYCCIRYYTLKKDMKGKDIACIIYALAAYPSIFFNYFKYGAKPGVMQYTVDNMTKKFMLKNTGHIFGTLRESIGNSWEFHKDYFADANDKEIIRFIQRIRNDQNSLLKKIANEYYKNYEKGLTVNRTADSFEDNAVVDDILNNTSVVEDIARSVVNSMLTSGVNLKFAEIAAKLCQISIVDTRFYITKIIVDKNSMVLQKFIEAILFIYLYDEHHKKEDINSSHFLAKFAPELFKKTNSNNQNIKFIKGTLDKWGEESGVHAQFKREASRISYKKAIYFYIILSIQNYTN